jgi:hypothetical protein
LSKFLHNFIFRNECYCGYNSGRAEKVDDSNCNMPCSYNSSQACGGENFYSIWRIKLCIITFISIFLTYKSKENERLTYFLVNVSFEIF